MKLSSVAIPMGSDDGALRNHIRPLRYQSLAKLRDSFDGKNEGIIVEERNQADDEMTNICHDIEALLKSKAWLLEPDQHLDFPDISLEDDKRKIFSLSDFYVRQEQNLLKDVEKSAFGPYGQRLSLSQQQLTELLDTGRVTIPSFFFEDQQHIWELNPSFYSSPATAKSRWKRGIGRALDHLIVYAFDAMCSANQGCSLYKAVRDGFLKSIRFFRDCIVECTCIPRRRVKYSDWEIACLLDESERLFVQHHMQDCLPGYRDASKFVASDHWDELMVDAKFGESWIPPSRNKEQEKRAHEKFQRRVSVRVEEIKCDLDRRKNGNDFQIDRSQLESSPLEALREKRHADQKWEMQSKDEVIKKLIFSKDNEFKAEGYRLLLEKIREDVEDEEEKERTAMRQVREEELCRERSIMFLSKVWRTRRLDEYVHSMKLQHDRDRWSRLNALVIGDPLSTPEFVRLLTLTSEFRTKHAPIIEERLQKIKVAWPSACFFMPKLDSKQWFRDEHGRYQKVEVDRESSFWRAKYIYYTFLSTTLNLGFSSYQFLVNGPLSLRALFSASPYYACSSENQEHDRISLTQTLLSRIKSFHNSVCTVRNEFEKQPDLGIIGKPIQRIILDIYLKVKLLIGTIVISAFMIGGTLFGSVASCAILIVSPIVSGVFTLLTIGFSFFVFDAMHPEPGLSPFFKMLVGTPYYVLVPGILQGIIASSQFAIHPAVGAMIFLLSNGRFAWTSLRDLLTGPVIRRFAKVPGADTFLATRIHGPGLSSKYFYRVPNAKVIQAVKAALDLWRLEAFRKLRYTEILAPFQHYNHLVQSLIEPLGYTCTPGSDRPEKVCQSLLGSWKADHLKRKMRVENAQCTDTGFRGRPSGLWEELSAQLRTAHPDFRQQQFHEPTVKIDSVDDIDHDILETFNDSSLPKSVNFLCEMARRAGTLLAELELRVILREQRLRFICSFPEEARGKFRVSDADLDSLWKDTMIVAELYANQIESELFYLSEKSHFQEDLQPVAEAAVDSFWRNQDARPRNDVEVVAAHILSVLFGGDMMMEPMEQIDRSLILIPKLSKEDEHLDFFGQRNTFNSGTLCGE
jgi:hypothetical protein